MRERSTVLASATFGFVAIASLSVQSTHAVAADECLTKPNSPAPQGQHWYYRLDHAANRQCWRLGPEGLRVQKSAPQAEKNPRLLPSHNRQRRCARSALKPRARPLHVRKPRMRRQRPMQILRQRLHPHRGLKSPRMPDLPASEQLAPDSVRGTQTASASDVVPVADNSLPATASEPPVAAPAEEPSPPAAPPAPIKRGEIDHTFALLMIVFAVLGIAGPIIHFVDRRRRRRIIISKEEPPQWARVVTLNTPSPRVHVSLPSGSARRTPPIPPTPIDQTERLAQALQQLVDRLHTQPRPEPGAATPPIQRADTEMIRKRPIALRN